MAQSLKLHFDHSFFFENAGELHFIVLERKNGPHTTPSSHMETGYESQGSNIKGSSLEKQKNMTWPHLSN
jgi:hypothetical protein